MTRTVGIGFQDFGKLIESGCFYVDKTAFIKEWWENKDCVTLITRPRRFGKTLNMSMLEYFFSNKYAGRGDLFEGLSIWEDEKYRKLQGTYPVISLSFASVKDADYESMKYSVRSIIGRLYGQHRYLLEGDTLTGDEKTYFGEIENFRGNLKDADYTRALNVLSEYMYRYFGKEVIILLDEYDTPMQEAYLNGYWDKMVEFTRNLFNSTFKNNSYLYRAVMTGITVPVMAQKFAKQTSKGSDLSETMISKESIFSDLNNLEVVTTTSDKYATSFGLTEEEVFAALDEYGMSDKKQETKDWYDGFTFGSHSDIYNPWSVLNLLDKKEFETYWANTSTNGLVVGLKGRYVITSNRESGFGRYDVMLEPLKSDDDAIIMEFKVHDLEDEKDLKDTVAVALAQIEDRQYAATLVAKGFRQEKIRKYGFAFEGKKVLIGA